jgi:hypothetical protein
MMNDELIAGIDGAPTDIFIIPHSSFIITHR